MRAFVASETVTRRGWQSRRSTLTTLLRLVRCDSATIRAGAIPSASIDSRLETRLAFGGVRDHALYLARNWPGDQRLHVVARVDDDQAPRREAGNEIALVLAAGRVDHLVRPRPRDVEPLYSDVGDRDAGLVSLERQRLAEGFQQVVLLRVLLPDGRASSARRVSRGDAAHSDEPTVARGGGLTKAALARTIRQGPADRIAAETAFRVVGAPQAGVSSPGLAYRP